MDGGTESTCDGDEKADVGLGEAVADEVVLTLEDPLKPVERRKERGDSGLVCVLRRRHPGLVHPICHPHARSNTHTCTTRRTLTVDGIVHPLAQLVDLLRIISNNARWSIASPLMQCLN